MNRLTPALLFAAVLTTALVGFSGTAHAQYRHHDVGPVTLNAQFNYGFHTDDGDLNGYGAGLGLRGGYTLDMGLYLGGTFDYFFGEGESAGAFGVVGADIHRNVYDFMAEVGYDFWIYRRGVLRPKIGLGVGIEHVSGCANAIIVGGTCRGDSQTGFAIAPGLQFMHFFSNVYFSGELRFETVSGVDGPDPSAFIFGLGVGVAL